MTLKSKGKEVIMLTGDNERTAKSVASQRLISDRVIAQVLPHQKEEDNFRIKVRRQNKIVAMVGDGINDAPALAVADLGMQLARVQMLRKKLEELF